MNLLLHLMRKDGRATWPAGLLVILLSAALALLPMRGWASQEISWQILTLWLSLAAWLAVVLLLKGMIRTDAALDSSRFIGTRPVSGRQVIASKLLIMLLVGLLPVVLAVMVRMLRTGVSVSVVDLGTVALANLSLLVALLGILTLPMVMPGRGAWMDLVSVIAALVLAVWGIPENVVLLDLDKTWYELALGLGWAALTLVVAVYLRLTPLKALAACVLVAASVTFLNGMEASRRPEQAVVKSPVELQLRPAEVSLRMHSRMNEVGSLNVDVWVQALPEGVFAECIRVDNVITFEDIGSRVKTARPVLQVNGWVVPPDCAYAVLRGDAVKTVASSQAGQRLNLDFGIGDFPSLKPPVQVKARLRGSMVLNLYRTIFDQTLPFQEGLEWSGKNVHFQLNEVFKTESGIPMMYVDADILRLRAGRTRQVFGLGVEEYGFFGVDATSHELFRLESSGSEATLSPLLRHEQSREIMHVTLMRNWWPGINAQRASDPARPLRVDPMKISLGIFRREKIATVKVPYDWPDMTVNVR